MNSREDRIRELQEWGRHCAERGGSFYENPYFADRNPWNDWAYDAWHEGFMERRAVDPKCPKCQGTGFLNEPPVEMELPFYIDWGKLGDVLNMQFECYCNAPQKRGPF